MDYEEIFFLPPDIGVAVHLFLEDDMKKQKLEKLLNHVQKLQC